jgi:hypothetical protein
MARPKGSKNKRTVFLNNLLDEHKFKDKAGKAAKFDWRADLAQAIFLKDYITINFYLPLLPFLVSKMVQKDFAPITPEESVKRVSELFQEAKKAHVAKSLQSNSNPGGMEARRPSPTEETNSIAPRTDMGGQPI